MSYINYSLGNNRGINEQRNYLRNKSENNFIRKNYINYDKVYNSFLTSRYPPMYYKSPTIDNDNQYNDFSYKDEINNYDNDAINNYQYRKYQTINDLNSPRDRYNNYKFENKNEYNNLDYLDDYYSFNRNENENEMRRKQQTPRNNLMLKKNYHFKKNDTNGEININENISENNNIFNNYQLTEDSNNIHDYKNINPYSLNGKESLFSKRNNNNLNLNMIDYNNNNDKNNNKLYLSHDYINDRLNNRGYLSPIITKIAKKNYLGDNPYTDKDPNLGPSILKKNPILYPIDTYKFDFNRYIKNDYVNKYV